VNRFVFAKQRNPASKLFSSPIQLDWSKKLEGGIAPLWRYGRGFRVGRLIHLLFLKRRDQLANAVMKLRLHRKYSIKLMLAWESCRFDSLFPLYDL
jgi:hypothetical protein